ncbi:MAG: hypothetical protein HY906_17880 [Deltaproteobacteria bacterium]|nr:hypothetical protein [Deltaproteobacteria bacterium]
MIRRSHRGAVAAALLAGALVSSGGAHGRNPPIAVDPRGGVWIAVGEVFVFENRDQWSVFPAPGTVNHLVIDDTILWIATDEGVIRFDTGTRKSTRLVMDDGLPSQAVAAVAYDEQFVWFATNKGLVRYRKLDRTLRVYTEKEGLPDTAVNFALTVGRQVWFATRNGIALYDPATDGFRPYTTADGLAGEDIAELYQVGDDLWCRHDRGLSRFRPKTRFFSNFGSRELGSQVVYAFVNDSEGLWVGTDQGLLTINPSSDAVYPFPQQDALKGKSIKGLEVFGDYLFITTDTEVVQYYKPTRALTRFTEADGLLRQAGATGTLIGSGVFTMMFTDGAWVFDIQRAVWTFKTFKATARASERGSSVRVFGTLNLLQPYDFHSRTWSADRYATVESGFGVGLRFGKGRSLDATIRLDYGQIEPLVGQCGTPAGRKLWCPVPNYRFTYRDLTYKLEYLGNENDVVREIVASDKWQYRTKEEGLEKPVLLQGGQVRLAERGKDSKVQGTLVTGQRRGATQRDFIAGPRQDIYQLSQKYILPGTERIYVDGELQVNGTDYTIIYPSGQLAFLDPERVDELSIIEVEYEYDLVAKKSLGALSILDMLPADREVGDWSRTGQARLISEETGLYQQIDGAAPKYIDRGWKRSVYLEYRQGSRAIQVAIHDMGDEVNAENLYNYDLPSAREVVPVVVADDPGAALVLDLGLATAYAAKAHSKSYYLELTIDEKSDAAKASLKLFATQVMTRGSTAGQSAGGDVRELVAAARIAASPVKGFEVGVRATELWGIGPTVNGRLPRRMTTGVFDGRYERQLGERGRLTAYAELAGTHGHNPGDSDGWAGMGFLRVAHPWLEGMLSARHYSGGYLGMGSLDTMFTSAEHQARLRDEVRLHATGYPLRWLPATAFFLRQTSSIDDGSFGVVQQAFGRVQLTRESLPATSLQFGHTLVEGLDSTVSRVKAVGQVDYDLARGLLKWTGMKRFLVRAFYGFSQAETEEHGAFAHADRVQLLRVEGKLAPNATESAYALFRQRKVWRQEDEGNNFGLQLHHWELLSGARSSYVKGLIPQVTYNVTYDDDRITNPALPFRTSKGSLGGALGIYPGQWWSKLTPVVLEPRYSVAADDRSEADLRTLQQRIHRFDNRAVYAGGGKIDLDLYQLWERGLNDEDQHRTTERLELRNRVVWRPRPTSPLTFRLNYASLRSLNDTTLGVAAPEWGRNQTYETVVEWLMRWNKMFTTKLKWSFGHGLTTDLLVAGAATGTGPAVKTYRQERTGPETELRIFPMEEASRLFLIQRNGVFYLWGKDQAGTATADEGHIDGWEFYVAGGAIWVIGDRLYLDGEVLFRQTRCLDPTQLSCQPSSPIEVRLFLTFNL